MQELVQQQFKTLMQVCLGSANLLDNLETIMQEAAERFLNTRLGAIDIAEMYLAHRPQEGEAEADLALAFQEAAPALAGQRPPTAKEICFLALPTNEAGQQLRDRVVTALNCPELGIVDNGEDIAFYREIPQLFVSDLEQLGPLALAAYRQMTGIEHFTPHTRIDIQRWRAATTG
jgi:eukaryotic-like serine/threonine-protein kinase